MRGISLQHGDCLTPSPPRRLGPAPHPSGPSGQSWRRQRCGSRFQAQRPTLAFCHLIPERSPAQLARSWAGCWQAGVGMDFRDAGHQPSSAWAQQDGTRQREEAAGRGREHPCPQRGSAWLCCALLDKSLNPSVPDATLQQRRTWEAGLLGPSEATPAGL